MRISTHELQLGNGMKKGGIDEVDVLDNRQVKVERTGDAALRETK